MNKRKHKFKFQLSSWTVMKGEVTHFCVQQSHMMRCGYIILHLRPKGPVWNGKTKMCLHWKRWRPHFPRESYGQRFFEDSEDILFIDFLKQQTINAAYYLKFLEDWVKPAFCSKWLGQSVKSIAPPWCAYTHCHCDIRTFEEMYSEVLPHLAYSSGLAPSNFHLLCPLKEALRGKRFGAENEVELFVQWWLDKQTIHERAKWRCLSNGGGV